MKLLLLVLFSVAAALKDYPPISLVDPVKDLGFVPVSRSRDAVPVASLWGNVSKPLPTNVWWENLVMGDGIENANNVFNMPYVFEVASTGVTTMYPFLLMSGTQQVLNAWDAVVAKIILGAVENTGPHTIKRFDQLSVMLRWGSETAGHMSAPLVKGNPYVTMFYADLTPQVTAPQQALNVTVDGNRVNCTGNSFTVQQSMDFIMLQSDATWRLYVSSPVNFTCSTSPASFSLKASATMVGALRLALVNNCTIGNNLQQCEKQGVPREQSEWSALLDQHAQAVVVGGSLDLSSADSGIYRFVFDVSGLSPSSSSIPPPLMLALPHHVASFSSAFGSNVVFGPGHRNVRGFARPVIGATWEFQERIPTISFRAPRPIDADKLEDVRAAVKADAAYNPPENYQVGAGDPYFAGKMLARMARIALIAEEIGENQIASDMISRLKTYLQVWLDHTSLNPLIYDQDWGGIVSCGCRYDNGKCDNAGPPGDCPALTDSGMDFGNAYYNDHHFHYGYLIYAAAAIAHFDASWLGTYHQRVLVLVRDLVNPSTEDMFFTQFRYKDWYDGHAWASGIPLAGGQPYLNGKNQESVSESINAFYAIALYGQVSNEPSLASLANLMLATELRAAHTYWQVMDNSEVYPAAYWPNKVVGILWTHLAQAQTWFGMAQYLVHGIQTIPNTPISEYLLRSDWVTEEYPVFSKACDSDGGCATGGWNILVYLSQAVVDKASAWANVKKLPDSLFDNNLPGANGHSRTNTYYFVATRP